MQKICIAGIKGFSAAAVRSAACHKTHGDQKGLIAHGVPAGPSNDARSDLNLMKPRARFVSRGYIWNLHGKCWPRCRQCTKTRFPWQHRDYNSYQEEDAVYELHAGGTRQKAARGCLES